MKHSINHPTGNQYSDTTQRGIPANISKTVPFTPLDTIKNWFCAQTDERLITEFTDLVSYFHPDDSYERELRPERRKETFRRYITVTCKERRDNVRRSLMLITLIDLVIDYKKHDEQQIGVPDMLHYKWTAWSQEWRKLRKTVLINRKIWGWFFQSKTL